MDGKKILLGVTGSIAAYKSILLVRLLVKSNAEVKVILTPASKDFVSPLTLSTLSKNPVLTGLFEEDSWSNHVMLGRWADIMVIAPLSCNTLSKMAHGACDNLLLATYLSATCPVVVAPAMDEDMWHHPTTVSNLAKLISFNNLVIPAEEGELASGLYGEGRMAEPETIIHFLQRYFSGKKDLEGKKVMITAGPTHEPIDPVRFIGNHSSGKMGIALASEMAGRGASVHLIMGPGSESPPVHPAIRVSRVQSAQDMFEACSKDFPRCDIAIMAAAVADFTPLKVATEKIKKTAESLTIELAKTRDILKSLGELKREDQVLVGFALETENEREYALNKMKIKNADMIVLNSLKDAGAGFGYDTNKVTIFEKNGIETSYDQKPKQQVAKDIVDKIVKMLYA